MYCIVLANLVTMSQVPIYSNPPMELCGTVISRRPQHTWPWPHYHTFRSWQMWHVKVWTTYGKINALAEVMSTRKWHISRHEGNIFETTSQNSSPNLCLSFTCFAHNTSWFTNIWDLTQFSYKYHNYTLVGGLISCTTQSKSNHPHDQNGLPRNVHVHYMPLLLWSMLRNQESKLPFMSLPSSGS